MLKNSSLVIKARAVSCVSLTMVLAACGGGTGNDSSAKAGQDIQTTTNAAVTSASGEAVTSQLLASTLTSVTTTYLAENATPVGNLYLSTEAAHLGNGYLTPFRAVNDSATFTVNAAVTGEYDIGLRYANASTTDKTMSIYVNGVKLRQTKMVKLANWSTWGVKIERVTLPAGTSKIKYQHDSADTGLINMNNIFFTLVVAATTSTTTTPSTSTTTTPTTTTPTTTTTTTPTTTTPTTTTPTTTTPTKTSTKNYYVATTGSDSNPGTQAAPFRTIKKAASVATAGYTVHVADGTYNEQITSSPSGTASAYITYVSDNKWGAKIVSPGTGTTAAWQNNGDYVAILGFDITGGGALGINHSGSGDIASYNHVHHIPAVGCTGFGGAGIGFDNYNGKSGFLADSNVVHDIGPLGTSCGRVQGIYPSIPNGTISNNLVYRVVGYALHAYHNVYNTKIVNNTVFGNGNPGGDGGGIAIGGNTSGFPTSAGFIVTNNIVYDNQGLGIHEEGTQGANIYSNNLVSSNTTNYGTIHSPHAADVTSNPLFVNYIRNGGGNYHLTNSSPAVNTGTSNGAPSTDLDGAVRAQGAGYDIGAYKYY